jgi:hypothetical protein
MKKIVVIAALLAGVVAQAGDSGCGLGSVVVSKNSKGLQLLSLTTNFSFFSQAFGITSGTSGCSSSGLVQTDKEIQYYVEVNQDDISKEMAQGQGEKLRTLAVMTGCDSAESQAAFYSMTKDSYDKIVRSSNTSSQELVSNLKKQMSEDEEVALLCNTASL